MVVSRRTAYSRAVRSFSSVLVFVLVASATAWSQTRCVLTHSGSTDGGWLSPATRATCACSECRLFVEARLSSSTFGGPGSFSGEFDNQYGSFYFSFVDLERYSWRATPRLADGGTLPASVEALATADMSSPTVPGDVRLTRGDGGLISLSFDASVDPETGIATYLAIYRVPSTTEGGLLGGSGRSPLDTDLGPGDWVIALVSQNNVDQQSNAAYLAAPVHVDADPLLAPPPAPVMSSPIFLSPAVVAYITATADAFHLLGEDDDGGVAVRFNRTVATGATTGAYGWFPVECRHRVRAARVLNGVVSDWSPLSQTFMVDLTPPSAPGVVSTSVTGAAVQLGWSAAVDACGVDHYVVERSLEGGPFAVIGPGVSGLAFSDTVPAGARQVDYRVSAVDVAGRRGPFSSARVSLADAGSSEDGGQVDAGLDAGTPDAGDIDAGGPDAGALQRGAYLVGCGCTSSHALLSLLALAMLSMGRTRRSRAR